MLCAEEGDGAEAQPGCSPRPGSAQSSAGCCSLAPPARNDSTPPATAASTPARPRLPSAAPFSHLVSSGGQRRSSCSPAPAGLPAPRLLPPAHAVPAAPGCPPPCAPCFLPCAWLCLSLGAGPGLSFPIDPEGRAGRPGRGEPRRRRERARGGPGTGVERLREPPPSPAAPLRPLAIVVLYYFVLLGLLPCLLPPFYFGAPRLGALTPVTATLWEFNLFAVVSLFVFFLRSFPVPRCLYDAVPGLPPPPGGVSDQ